MQDGAEGIRQGDRCATSRWTSRPTLRARGIRWTRITRRSISTATGSRPVATPQGGIQTPLEREGRRRPRGVWPRAFANSYGAGGPVGDDDHGSFRPRPPRLRQLGASSTPSMSPARKPRLRTADRRVVCVQRRSHRQARSRAMSSDAAPRRNFTSVTFLQDVEPCEWQARLLASAPHLRPFAPSSSPAGGCRETMDPYRSPEHVHGYRLAMPPRRTPPVGVARFSDEPEFCVGPPAPQPVQSADFGLLLRGEGAAPCGRWRILRLLPDGSHAGLGSMVRRIDVREIRHMRRAVGSFGASTSRTLMLSLGEPIGVALNGDRFVDHRSFLAGSHAGPLRTRHVGHHIGLQVDLEPLAAYRLTGIPGAKLADCVVDLPSATNRLADLEENLAACNDARERLATLERALEAAILEGPEPDPLVAWLWGRLVRDRGRARIADLVAETGFSHRHVASRFREQVGLTPKTAARILRFEMAVERLAQGESAAQVAASCGFSDQSHLSREVASLGGSPPSIVAASSEGRWVWTH